MSARFRAVALIFTSSDLEFTDGFGTDPMYLMEMEIFEKRAWVDMNGEKSHRQRNR